jgi:hypothetical protein
MQAVPFSDLTLSKNFEIRDLGVGLSLEQTKEFERKLQALEYRSPAFSFIRLTFLKIGRMKKGSLKINAAGRTFRSVATGDSLSAIYDQVEGEVNKQLFQWKKKRFSKGHLVLENKEMRRKLQGGRL